MPDPEGYVTKRLDEGGRQINYFLSVALSVKNHHTAAVHFDPTLWHPVFF